MAKIGSAKWNDQMYALHPTPYHNRMAGMIEKARVFIIKHLANIQSSDTVLEIGCEGGNLLSRLPRSRVMVGLDISAAALKDAAKRLGRGVKLIKADAQKKIPLPKESFDVVICSQTLEHVKYPKKIMDNIYHLAKKNARVIISVPNEVFLGQLKKVLMSIWPISKLLAGIEDEQSEWHLQTFTDQMVKKLVQPDFQIKSAKKVCNIYLVYLLKKI